MASAIAAEGGPDARSDLFRIVLGDHSDVVDEVGEEGRDDPTVAGFLDLERSRGRRGRRGDVVGVGRPRPRRPTVSRSSLAPH